MSPSALVIEKLKTDWEHGERERDGRSLWSNGKIEAPTRKD